MIDKQKERILEFKEAVSDGDVNRLEQLKNSNPELIHQTIAPLGPWLNMATALRSSDMLEKLLQLGANPNTKRRSSNENALAAAAGNGNAEMVRILFKAGAVMDTSDTIANPLFASVHGRNVEVAQFLLDQGIDSTIKYKTRRELDISALDFAWEMGARDIARAIAVHQSGGDELKAQALLNEADRIAHINTEPVADD